MKTLEPGETGEVTRIELIDATGRVLVRHYEQPGAVVSLQDDGRTLKIFAGTPR
jgi:hypothetical protein